MGREPWDSERRRVGVLRVIFSHTSLSHLVGVKLKQHTGGHTYVLYVEIHTQR